MEMNLPQMIVDKIRREEIDQGVAAEQISRYYPISRSAVNRFINHNKIRNPRQLLAIARWLGFIDREALLDVLQLYGFLPALDETIGRRLTIEYRLNAIRKELEDLARLLQSEAPKYPSLD